MLIPVVYLFLPALVPVGSSLFGKPFRSLLLTARIGWFALGLQTAAAIAFFVVCGLVPTMAYGGCADWRGNWHGAFWTTAAVVVALGGFTGWLAGAEETSPNVRVIRIACSSLLIAVVASVWIAFTFCDPT